MTNGNGKPRSIAANPQRRFPGRFSDCSNPMVASFVIRTSRQFTRCTMARHFSYRGEEPGELNYTTWLVRNRMFSTSFAMPICTRVSGEVTPPTEGCRSARVPKLMTTTIERLRAEQHVTIGDLIGQCVWEIITRWAERAKEEQPNAQRVHHDVLVDHLPAFLTKLGHSLSVAGDDSESPQREAVEHGDQRWDHGW